MEKPTTMTTVGSIQVSNVPEGGVVLPARRRLPDVRAGFTRKFHIRRPEKASRADERSLIAKWLRKQGAEGERLAAQIVAKVHGSPEAEPLKIWATISTFPDGRPGEIFIKADKTGSLASGALDAVAIALSMAWQHGVPFETTMQKFVGMRFERWALDRFGKKEG